MAGTAAAKQENKRARDARHVDNFQAPMGRRHVSVKHTLNVPLSQLFVWMPRKRSFVEITQQADIILSSAAGWRNTCTESSELGHDSL